MKRSFCQWAGSVALLGVLGATLLAPLAAQADVVFSTNFEGAPPVGLTGWDLESMDSGTDGNFGDYGFSGSNWLRNTTANTTASLTLTGLGAHSTLSMDFLLAIIDSLDANDSFRVKVDGTEVFVAQMTAWNYSGPAIGTELVRNKELTGTWSNQGWTLDSGFDLSSVGVLHNIAHTGSTAVIEFVARVDEDKWNEGFAIDDLKVSANGGTVPEPSSFALAGLALVGLALVRSKKPRVG